MRYSIENPLAYIDSNIVGFTNILEGCRHTGVQHLVYASSSSVYGDLVAMPMREDALPQPVSPYGVSKLAAEQLCYLYFVNFGVPTVSLPVSKATIASLLSLTPEYFSRVLRELEDKGLIEMDKREIRIPDSRLLARYSAQRETCS